MSDLTDRGSLNANTASRSKDKDNKLDTYASVAKWTTKAKLVEKDFVIVPINEK